MRSLVSCVARARSRTTWAKSRSTASEISSRRAASAMKERHRLRHETKPVGVVLRTLAGDVCRLEDLAAGAHQAVAGGEAQAEPGALAPLVEGGKPERNLGELDGGRVQVHAVA